MKFGFEVSLKEGANRTNDGQQEAAGRIGFALSPTTPLAITYMDNSVSSQGLEISSQDFPNQNGVRGFVRESEETSQFSSPKFGLNHILNPEDTNGRRGSERDGPVLDNTSDMSYPVSDDIMEPFMLYSEFHSTLRDYMFLNAGAPDFGMPLQSSALNDELASLQRPKRPDMDVSQSELGRRIQEFTESSLETQFDLADFSPMQKLHLYQNYVTEIAPWLDMFDMYRTFGTCIPHLASTNRALLYSIYAISSRQLELTSAPYLKPLTLRLYQEALKELIPTINKAADSVMISSCVLLCVLEMMSSSPNEWRHHLDGCAALFMANDINGFSDNLDKGLFWCYARMDICSALISETTTLIPSENWLPKNVAMEQLKMCFLKSGSIDMYANYMVFLCSRVLNLISTEALDYDEQWKHLWDEIIQWRVDRPQELQPLAEYDDTPFPGILYLVGPAISSNQLYHMAIILLTDSKPHRFKIEASQHIVCCFIKIFASFY